MTEFKEGDKVKCIDNSFDLLGITLGKIYPVLKVKEIDIVITCDDGCAMHFPKKLFKLVEKENMEFNVGDKVKCIDKTNYPNDWYTIDKIYEIQSFLGSYEFQSLKNDKGENCHFRNEDFELVEEEKIILPEGYEIDMDAVKQKEFKVDKLGWYEILTESIGKGSEKFLKVLIIDNENICVRWNKVLWVFEVKNNGFLVSNEIDLTLIKYLGPELPKEPRKFEFEGYLCEFPYIPSGKNMSLDFALGHKCHDFNISKDDISKITTLGVERKVSKWKIIGEEIIDEI